jgi:hypothetical protein
VSTTLGVVLGWNADQWAIALAWAGAKPLTIGEAIDVRTRWRAQFLHDPQQTLVGVEPRRDAAAAVAFFAAALKEFR